MARQRGGAPPNEKAAARPENRGGGGSLNPITARTSYRRPGTAARQAQAGEIVVYDGLTCSGWLQPRAGRWMAFAADGRFLGSHSSDKLGARAIYEAHQPGGAR